MSADAAMNDRPALSVLPEDGGAKTRLGAEPAGSAPHGRMPGAIGQLLLEERLVTESELNMALARQKNMRAKKLGDFLTENQIISHEELERAIRHQRLIPMARLGEILAELGLVSAEDLDAALALQQQNRALPLGQILVKMGLIDDQLLKAVLARKLGIPYVKLADFNVSPEAVKLIPKMQARKYAVLPICVGDNQLTVAMEDPLDASKLAELRFLTQKRITPVMASKADIIAAIGLHYEEPALSCTGWHSAPAKPAPGEAVVTAPAAAKVQPLPYAVDYEPATVEPAIDVSDFASDHAVVQLVNSMILSAYRQGASDIHIESYPDKNSRVRFRKDGSLMDHGEIAVEFRDAVVSRIKIMSQLDISERRKPQDGKMFFDQFGPRLELRVATVPTVNGLEDVVLRVPSSGKIIPAEELGLAESSLKVLKRLMERPYGLILVCGPTGSGKTTTLHSLIKHINTPDRKIWTAEDPVEITQPGLRQVQVNSKIGWSFAAAIRSFLRADPDVIMVGEMRDPETAKIVIEGSLTGHLVLSTLHTNNACESVARLLDLGMDRFNFADALLAVLAQRLAKALCPDCKQSHDAGDDELADIAVDYCQGTELEPETVIRQWKIEAEPSGGVKLHHRTGCPECGHSGYRGRIGLHELLTVTPTIKRLIQTGAPISELSAASRAAGMRMLKQDGIIKVLQGHTDMAQIRSVCY